MLLVQYLPYLPCIWSFRVIVTPPLLRHHQISHKRWWDFCCFYCNVGFAPMNVLLESHKTPGFINDNVSMNKISQQDRRDKQAQRCCFQNVPQAQLQPWKCDVCLSRWNHSVTTTIKDVFVDWGYFLVSRRGKNKVPRQQTQPQEELLWMQQLLCSCLISSPDHMSLRLTYLSFY